MEGIGTLLFNTLKAVLLGIVQGVTEWLPISSTGHLIILDNIIKLDVTEDFRKVFLIFIYSGLNAAIFYAFHAAKL